MIAVCNGRNAAERERKRAGESATGAVAVRIRRQIDADVNHLAIAEPVAASGRLPPAASGPNPGPYSVLKVRLCLTATSYGVLRHAASASHAGGGPDRLVMEPPARSFARPAR